MRHLILAALACMITAIEASAQQSDCSAITDDKARLACFERSKVKAEKKLQSAPAKLQPAVAVAGWTLQKKASNFSGEVDCYLSPRGKPHVQISKDVMYVSYRGRGGVQGFRFRLDDEPISDMRLPTPIDQQIGAVRVDGVDFNGILNAQRLRLQVLTLIAGIAEEDIRLSGIAEQYARMRRECR